MAKYHENLKYHEDEITKHKITDEELKFLSDLQKELNTQDNVGQANPRFWVIKGSEKEYGIETGYEDGVDLIDEDGYDVVATDILSAMEYIKDNLLEEINDCEDFQHLDSMEEIADWLNNNGYNYRISNYRIKEIIYPNTMFLTQKDAENYLRANYYHYSEGAHTYAMTAWRDWRIDKLIKILQEVDFTK